MPQNADSSEILQESFIIRLSKRNLLFMAFLSLALVLVGIWLLSISRDHEGRDYMAGGMTLIFGGLCLLVSLFYLFDPLPLLTIDAQGMLSHTLFRRSRTIEWKEIDMIYTYRTRYNQYFVVSLSSAGKQTYIARNFRNGHIPSSLLRDDFSQAVSIPLFLSDRSYENITELIHKQYGKQIRRNHIQLHASCPF